MQGCNAGLQGKAAVVQASGVAVVQASGAAVVQSRAESGHGR